MRTHPPVHPALTHSPVPVRSLPPPPDLYEVVRHHRERGTAMLPHVFKSAMYQVRRPLA